jgi:hypothetical protein
MGSRLQSNGITPAEKVGTLIPSGIFHSFLSPVCVLVNRQAGGLDLRQQVVQVGS